MSAQSLQAAVIDTGACRTGRFDHSNVIRVEFAHPMGAPAKARSAEHPARVAARSPRAMEHAAV